MPKLNIVLPDPPFFDTALLEELRGPDIDITIYRDLALDAEQLQERIKDADIIVVDLLSTYNEASLKEAKNLKHIVAATVGLNHIDLEYCRQRGISVHNFTNYNSRAVAEMAFGNLVALIRHIPLAVQTVRANLWTTDYFVGEELKSKTLGVIGAGNVGREIISIGKGFNMNVLCHTKNPTPARAKELGLGAFSTLEEVLSKSDFVMLSVVATKETQHLINAKTLALMRPSSYLINMSRHFLVDAKALAAALYRKEIAGAALDFVGDEPYHLRGDDLDIQEMINRPNVIVTPHIGFNTVEAMERLAIDVNNTVRSLVKELS